MSRASIPKGNPAKRALDFAKTPKYPTAQFAHARAVPRESEARLVPSLLLISPARQPAPSSNRRDLHSNSGPSAIAHETLFHPWPFSSLLDLVLVTLRV